MWIAMKRDDYINKLKKIDFFKDGMHPEYMPFVGEDYAKYKILHVGESHYIAEDAKLTLDDYKGWWEGKQSENLSKLADGWYNTDNIVNWYMQGERHKGHGIFTNVLKSFCKVVVPNEYFTAITTEDSKKYNYFAFMNFYQMPSIYNGVNFTKALCAAGEKENLSAEQIDNIWSECMEKSAKIFEDVVNALDPVSIVVSSREVEKYYCKVGKLFNDPRMIYVDHPDSAWWNKKKEGAEETSKEHLESRLKEIYYKTNK